MTAGAAPIAASTTAPAVRLRELIEREPPDRGAIARFLDGLEHGARLEAIRALSGTRIQRRLYEVVADAPRVTPADLVPREAPPLREIIYHGKNSLAAFTLFQKRFCRPAGGVEAVWGYNHQSLAWLTGPGYFVVHDDPRGAAIDYREIPPSRPPGWPEPKPNDRGFSRFVYRDMVDYMRRVSEHVFIGSAYRGGKEFGSFFVLCREP
jgi:hypothetical protein